MSFLHASLIREGFRAPEFASAEMRDAVMDTLTRATPLELDAVLAAYQATWASASSWWNVLNACPIDPGPAPRFVEFRVRGSWLGGLTAPPVANVGWIFEADDLESSETQAHAHEARRRNPAAFAALAGAYDQRYEADLHRLTEQGVAPEPARRIARVRAWIGLLGDALFEGIDHVRAVQALEIEPVRWIVRASLFFRTREGINYGVAADYWLPVAPDGRVIGEETAGGSVYIGYPHSALSVVPWIAGNERDLADDWLFTAGFFAWYGLSRCGW